MPEVTLTTLHGLKAKGEKITMLTCYDATFAKAASQAGVEVLLVGDSLGMVLQGHDSTLPVTTAEMAYHTACVKRGNDGALILADLPFMAHATPEQAFANCATLMQAGAHMIKLEGAAWLAETVRLLADRPSTCWAVTRCRAARKPRRGRCVPTPLPWNKPARPCCCSNACQVNWQRKSPRR